MDFMKTFFGWMYTGERAWFWMRQCGHLFVGALFAGFCWLLIWNGFPRVPLQIGASIFWVYIIIWKETLEDEKSQDRFKTYMDVIFNLLGFGLTMFLPEVWR